MDQQNPLHTDAERPDAPGRVPTEAEIARAEAEAAAAFAGRPAEKPYENVPYVDDAPPAPEAEADGDDEGAPVEPTPLEKWIDAQPEAKWRRVQSLAGAATGLASLAALFLLGADLSTYALLLALGLAILLPNYLERRLQRKLPLMRRWLLITMVVGIAAMTLYFGIRSNFTFTGGAD